MKSESKILTNFDIKKRSLPFTLALSTLLSVANITSVRAQSYSADAEYLKDIQAGKDTN
ncbi:MAG: hypothetical protein AAGE84_27135 [Cyanobacteria bacterium P01_G01_bin.39]